MQAPATKEHEGKQNHFHRRGRRRAQGNPGLAKSCAKFARKRTISRHICSTKEIQEQVARKTKIFGYVITARLGLPRIGVKVKLRTWSFWAKTLYGTLVWPLRRYIPLVFPEIVQISFQTQAHLDSRIENIRVRGNELLFCADLKSICADLNL